MNPGEEGGPQDTYNGKNYKLKQNNVFADKSIQRDPDNIPPVNQATDQHQNACQPNYAGGYSVIPPNQSKREQRQRVAQKEESDLQRWREKNRLGPIQLTPTQLGGAVSQEEARRKQMVESRQSIVQKRLKKQEMDRLKREAEEEEYKKKKAIQREKAMKQEEREKHKQQQRRQQLQQDHDVTMDRFLSRFEELNLSLVATSVTCPTSSWVGNSKEEKTREEEDEEQRRDLEIDRRRVNSAFLERLQNSVTVGSLEKAKFPTIAMEDSKKETWVPAKYPTQASAQPPKLVPRRSPTEFATHSTSTLDPQKQLRNDAEQNWVVMKLLNNFPFYEKEILEEIVTQCEGDYQRALGLLQ